MLSSDGFSIILLNDNKKSSLLGNEEEKRMSNPAKGGSIHASSIRLIVIPNKAD